MLADGDVLKALDIEYQVPLDYVYSALKHRLDSLVNKHKEKEGLFEFLASLHGFKLNNKSTSKKKPKSNAEFEAMLAQAGFQVR